MSPSRPFRYHRGRERCVSVLFFCRGTLTLWNFGFAVKYWTTAHSEKVPKCHRIFAKITCRSRRYRDFAIVLLGSFRRLPNAALSSSITSESYSDIGTAEQSFVCFAQIVFGYGSIEPSLRHLLRSSALSNFCNVHYRQISFSLKKSHFSNTFFRKNLQISKIFRIFAPDKV